MWEYSYDSCGNILSKTEYDYSENNGTWTQAAAGTAVNYSYNDSTWGDLLTAYNGQSITYDAMGNPLSYRGMSFTWQGGRQLAAVTKDGTTTSYAYNENGLRTSKTTDNETTTYFYSGDVLTGLETSSYSLYFHYDENGGIIGYTKHTAGTDTEYFYVKNLQGDILQVIDATGATAAQYSYDAWGNILTATGPEAETNPIRYRGYYFDTETGLYYLQSRYYDAEVGRFINADSVYCLGKEGSVLSFNLYCYCTNSPVITIDASGCWNWKGAAIGLAVFALGTIALSTTIATCGAAGPLAASTISIAASLINTAAFTAECALITSGAVISLCAANDSVAVIDVNTSSGGDRKGTCLVADFANSSCEGYSHYGNALTLDNGISLSVGIVKDYYQLGDYAGDFAEYSVSVGHFGLSYSQSPTNDFFTGCRATCVTFSTTAATPVGGGYAADYYVPFASWNF